MRRSVLARVWRLAAVAAVLAPLAISPVAAQFPPIPPTTVPALRVADGPHMSVADGLLHFQNAAPQALEEDDPRIAARAKQLQNDPDLIFEYVTNAIEVDPMFGLAKGAYGAMTFGYGTPFDQAELMVKLLRASGYRARYRYGPVTLNGARFKAWLGTDNAQAARGLLDDGGFPNDVVGTTTLDFATFLSIWVEAEICPTKGSNCGAWFQFNPAIKDHVWMAPADLKSMMGYDRAALRNASGALAVSGATTEYTGSASALSALLTPMATDLLDEFRDPSRAGTADDALIGGREIQFKTGTALRQTNLAEAPLGTSTTWEGEIPVEFKVKITTTKWTQNYVVLSIYGDDYYDKLLDRDNNLDGSGYTPVCGSSSGTCWDAGTLGFRFVIDHPYPANNGTYADSTYVKSRASTYFQSTVSDRMEIALGRENGALGRSTLADLSSAVTFVEDLGEAAIASHHTLAIHFKKKRSVERLMSVNASSGSSADRAAAIGGHSALFHFLEGASALDDVLSAPIGAVMWPGNPHDIFAQVQAANPQSRFLWITAQNLQATSAQFADPSETVQRLQPWFSAGYTGLLLAKDVTVKNVFWAIAPDGSVAHVLGNLKGGAGELKPPGVTKDFSESFNSGLFDPGGSFGVEPSSGQPTFTLPTLLSTGSGDFPKSLDFRMTWKEGAAAGGGGLGQWSYTLQEEWCLDPQFEDQPECHVRVDGQAWKDAATARHRSQQHIFSSLEHDLVLSSDTSFFLGSRSAAEATQVIVATVATMEEYRAGPDPVSGLVSMGVLSWLTSQLSDGVATVVHGVDGIQQFVRAPTGTWLSPPDSLDTLTQAGLAGSYGGKRLYADVSFTWRAADGQTKLFAQGIDGDPLFAIKLPVNSTDFNTLNLPTSYFPMTDWNFPSGEWVQARPTPNVSGWTWTNNYGRKLSMSDGGANRVVIDETGRRVTLTAPKTVQPWVLTNWPIPDIWSLAQQNWGVWFFLNGGVKLMINMPDGHRLWVTETIKSEEITERALYYNDPIAPLQRIRLAEVRKHTWWSASPQQIAASPPLATTVESITDADGVETRYAIAKGYRYAEGVVNTDSGQEVVSYASQVFNADGRTLESRSPAGRLTRYGYDAKGRLNDQRLYLASDPARYYNHTTYAHDAKGRKVETRVKTMTNGSSGQPYVGADIIASTTWNETWHKPATQTDPRGKVTSFTYHPTHGQLVQVDGPSGERTIHEYDSLGRLERTRVLVSAGVERITQFGYDAKGALQSTVVDPGTGRLNITTSFGYDAVGNLTDLTNPRGYSTTATYDVMRRLKTVTGPASAVELVYDGRGKLWRAEQKTADPAKPAVTSWDYSPAGRVLMVTDPEGAVTAHAYDTLGRLKSVTDPVGRRVESVYDLDGQVVETRRGAGTSVEKIEKVEYFPDGSVSCHRDGIDSEQGQPVGRVCYWPDIWGRPGAGTYYGDNTQVEYVERDPAGNVTSKRIRDLRVEHGGTDRFITFTYSNSGRLLSRTTPRPGGGTLTTITGYNFAGDVLWMTQDDGSDSMIGTVGYDYDTAGRLAYESRWVDYGELNGHTVYYEYDLAGNRTAIRWPDQYKATYAFDAENRLTSIGYVRPNGGGSGTFATYTVDPQALISQIAFGNGATASYQRRASGQPWKATWDWTASTDLETLYGYNGSGQQTYEHRSNPAFVWTPANDNSLELSSWSHPAIAKVGIFNQLQGEMRTTPAGAAAVSYAHDGRGNLTADGTRSFTYDYENRLEKVSRLSDGGTIATYQYDPLGRRIVKAVAGGATTWFMHAGDTEIADINPADSKVLRRYIPGPGVDNYVAFVDETAPAISRSVWASPENGAAWTSHFLGTPTSAGVIDGHNAFLFTGTSTQSGDVHQAQAVQAGESTTFSVTLQAVGGLTELYVGILGSSNLWGPNSGSTAEIVSGPGVITRDTGAGWRVSGLSASAPTRVRVTKAAAVSQTEIALVYVGSGGATALGSQTIISNPVFVVNRGNLWANWSYHYASQSPAGAIDGADAFLISAAQTPNWAGLIGNASAVGAGETASFTITLQASGGLTSSYLGLHGGAGGWGANSDATAEVVSGPGLLEQQSGGLWKLWGLSTSEPTRVRLTRRYGQGGSATPYLFIRDDVGPAPGDAVIVAGPEFNTGAEGQIKYVHHDRLGSVFALSDAQGAVAPQDRFVYDPYGNSPSASGGFPFRYTGQRYDAETGLYYYRARYYNPATGRFMQNDPIGVEGGLNLYGYVGGDPMNARDPTGEILEIKGDTAYVQSVEASIARLRSAPHGRELVRQLERSTRVVTIRDWDPTDPGNAAQPSSGRAAQNGSGSDVMVFFDPTSLNGGVNDKGSNRRPSFVGLAHEFGHARLMTEGIHPGLYGADECSGRPGCTRGREAGALATENKVRKEHGLIPRSSYNPPAKVDEDCKNNPRRRDCQLLGGAANRESGK